MFLLCYTLDVMTQCNAPSSSFVRQIFEHSRLPLVLISGKYHKSEIWWAAFPLLAVIVKNGSNSATVC